MYSIWYICDIVAHKVSVFNYCHGDHTLSLRRLPEYMHRHTAPDTLREDSYSLSSTRCRMLQICQQEIMQNTLQTCTTMHISMTVFGEFINTFINTRLAENYAHTTYRATLMHERNSRGPLEMTCQVTNKNTNPTTTLLCTKTGRLCCMNRISNKHTRRWHVGVVRRSEMRVM